MRFSPLLLGLLPLLDLAAPAPLCAQDGGVLRPGDRVRVEAPTQSGIYRVTALADEVLVLEASDGHEVRIPYAGLSRLLVDRGPGSRRSSAMKGFAIGGLAGVVGGGVSGFASGDDECRPSSWCLFVWSAEEKAVMGAVIAGSLGALVGAAIGGVSPGRRWESLRLPLTVHGGTGAMGGFRFGFSLSL